MGGAAVLVTGAMQRPPAAAVVSLSAESDPSSLVGLSLHTLSAGAAVSRLTSPTMYVVATGDRYASVEETRATYRATRTAGPCRAAGGLAVSVVPGTLWVPRTSPVALPCDFVSAAEVRAVSRPRLPPA